MATLIDDDPHFTYQAPTGEASRRMRAWRTGENSLVVVLTESGDGMSITNAAEEVAAALGKRFPGQRLTVIEYYPSAETLDGAAHYDQVWLEDGKPQWRRLSADDLTQVLDIPAIE